METTAKKVRVHSIVFLQSEEEVEPVLEHFDVDDLDDIDRDELVAYLKETYADGDPRATPGDVHDADDVDTEFLGYRVDAANGEKGYLLSLNSDLNYVGLSYFEAIPDKAPERAGRHVDRASLDLVGNTNGRDVHCRECGEPWENAGIVADFTQEELNRHVVLGPQSDDPHGPDTRIVALDGCPACRK